MPLRTEFDFGGRQARNRMKHKRLIWKVAEWNKSAQTLLSERTGVNSTGAGMRIGAFDALGLGLLRRRETTSR